MTVAAPEKEKRAPKVVKPYALTTAPFQNEWANRMADNIVWVDIWQDELTPAPGLCYIHRHEQQRMLAAILDLVGWCAPILYNVTTNHVIDGYLRYRTAQYHAVRYVPLLPVRLTVEEEEALVVLFNAIAKMAHMDDSKINEYLETVKKSTSNIKRLVYQARLEDAIPFNGEDSKLRNRTQERDAPLHQQNFAKRQVALHNKQVWSLGGAELIGTPEQCAPIIEAFEANGGEALQLL